MRPRNSVLLVAGFSALFALGFSAGSAAAEDPKPCVGTTFAVAAVKAACDSGGQPAAKKLMNKAKKTATAAGGTFECKDCHTDLKGYALTGPDAVTRLTALLSG